ncbi:DUF3488 and transglutaminase-like domain-containing protein [Solwaraspora sp. WMMB335]|uniref:DUF3488 and transglutaminase-like domain-containing protein n=1 Tax=Solwaraspora sp. WMMB335 TaxID=3404118 RepID=UPI003B94F0A5
MDSAVSRGRRILIAVLIAGALAVAAGAAGRVYAGAGCTVLMGGAAVGSVGSGLVLAGRRQWPVPFVSMAVLFCYVCLAVWGSARVANVAGSFPTVLVDALRGGRSLVTARVPIPVEPTTVVLPVVVVWLAGLVAAELALRAGRVALAGCPAVVVYLVALILAGPHGDVQPWRAVGFVCLVGMTLLVATAGVRTVGGVTAVVVGSVLVVPVVALSLSHQPADVLRGSDDRAVTDVLDGNPLARISGWLVNPAQPLLDVELADVGLADDARLTLAVLTEFDGVTWTIGDRYRRVESVLPPPVPPTGGPPPGGGTTVTQEIVVRELSGRLVPAISTPRRVSGLRLGYGVHSGTLLSDETLVAGTRYVVESEVPRQRTPEAAAAPTGPAVSRYLETGDSVPDDLVALARDISADATGADQKAEALRRFLREHYVHVHDAPSGHAYPNLRFFLLGPQPYGGRGTSEQFAAAYAVLGRLMGLPTRVVVGFSARPGRTTVRGADALAWPEVLFPGLGWVAVDPLPALGAVPRPLDQELLSSPRPQPPVSPPVSSATPAVRRPADAGGADRAVDRRTGPVGGPWLWSVGAGFPLAGLVTMMLVRSRQTRRRLRDGPPSDRALGAWLEVLDALRLVDRPPPVGLTASEVAEWAAGVDRRHRPLPPVRDVAALASAASFAPLVVDGPAASRAGSTTRAYVRALRRGASPWVRARWQLHPGPLYWRHGEPAGGGRRTARRAPPARDTARNA